MKNALLLLAIVAMIAVGAWFFRAGDQPSGASAPRDATPVSVYALEQQEFRDEVSALGTLRAWESVDISASVSQIVTSINFEDGQQVVKGDVLATLKQSAESATLREQEAALVDAKREVRRLENLARQNQVAQTDLDKARTQSKITEHKIEEIQARIADRTIVAPFSGVLGLRLVSEGALLTPGQRLTTLDDLSRMRLDFSVPATQLGFLDIGQPVEARAPAFETAFLGTISAIDSRIDPVSRSVIARATVENPDLRLRAGMLMEAIVRGEPRQALLVPEESLESRTQDHFVWRIEGDVARRVVVKIGSRRPGWVEILSGLSSGDRVVRDGVGMLRGEAAAIRIVGS